MPHANPQRTANRAKGRYEPPARRRRCEEQAPYTLTPSRLSAWLRAAIRPRWVATAPTTGP